MRAGSFLASLLLHSMLVLLVLMWPSTPPVDLSQAVKISLVEGAPGGEMMPSPVLGKTGSPEGTRRSESSRPEAQPIAPLPASEPIPIPKAPENIPADVTPEPPKAVAEIPRPESVPTPVPPPPPEEPKKVAEKKVEKAPEPQPQAKPETPAKTEQAKPKPEAQPKKTAEVSREDALKAALADAKKNAKPDPKSTPESRRQAAMASAMAELRRQSRKQGTGGGGGGEGDGPGGGGIYDVYTGLVIMAIQPHWSMTTFSSRQNFAVTVRIKLDRQGNVMDCYVEKASGNAAFDASAVNAINRARTLPPPPTPAQQDLIITFNSQDMMGR